MLGLHWKDVELANPSGPILHVRETWVEGGADTPKSKESRRTLTIGPALAEELVQHLARTPYSGADERVFPSSTGRAMDTARYADTFRLALKRGGVEGYVRPFHDGRHTNITHDAAAGGSPAAVQARTGTLPP